ncbi:Response regulator of zinc sigma-54-dependent two-component system [hydrothermal vent metagenome]|uniref:Response regulator of zinc sigma-54-dependent two-component system n=1 Tax=hydrothermal vent metagenome TaxID=652676 RepID=A0A3B1DCL7_9ZZZZ
MTKLAIIGAGKGGTSLIEILHKDPLVQIVGIADPYAKAPGLDLARRHKILAVTDYHELLQGDVDLVIDVTGNNAVREALEKEREGIEVIGGLAAKFMWQLIEERIKSKMMRETIRARYSFENMIGKNKKMEAIYALIPKIATTKATVLIEGESGTGKELVAHSIHQYSTREEKAFIRVNCAALAESLLESELFGHVRGAFTGAVAHKLGRFELADGGTLFLDEIGEISLSTQAKLLRAVQDGEIEKVGDARRVKVDVRVIAATNKDLKKAVEMGEFRHDLYYRLKVVPILLPPLRDRKDDIPLLVDHFIARFNKEMGRKVTQVEPEVMAILDAYDFPGNIRELENIIEHAMVFCTGDTLEAEHLQKEIQPARKSVINTVVEDEDPIHAMEEALILKVLTQTKWNYKKTAERLKMSRTTLWRKIKTYGLKKPSIVS